MAAQRDDPLGAKAPGGQHRGEPDSAITDDRDRVACFTPALTAAWWPVDITSDSVSSDLSIVVGVPDPGPARACRRRADADRFALAAVYFAVAEGPAVDAGES